MSLSAVNLKAPKVGTVFINSVASSHCIPNITCGLEQDCFSDLLSSPDLDQSPDFENSLVAKGSHLSKKDKKDKMFCFAMDKIPFKVTER